MHHRDQIDYIVSGFNPKAGKRSKEIENRLNFIKFNQKSQLIMTFSINFNHVRSFNQRFN